MPSIDTTAAATTAAAVAAPSPPTTTGSPTRIRGSIVAHLDTDTPAINASPVEIDGTPTTSPTQTQQQQEGEDKPAQQSLQQQLRGYKRGGSAGAGAVPSRSCSAGSSPDHLAREEEVLEEFGLGARGPGGEVSFFFPLFSRDCLRFFALFDIFLFFFWL